MASYAFHWKKIFKFEKTMQSTGQYTFKNKIMFMYLLIININTKLYERLVCGDITYRLDTLYNRMYD